jgi:hypothetical protein
MNKWIRLSAVLSLVCVVCAGVVVLSGCEDDPDTDAATEYFDEDYASADRDSTLAPRLELTPQISTLVNDGQSEGFFIIGGGRPYTWSVVSGAAGGITATGVDSALYTRFRYGDNAVRVRDARGEETYALINQPGGGDRSLSPSTAVLTNDTALAVFTVNNAVLPCAWSVVNGSRGHIAASGGTQATYERDAVGDNVVICTDSLGFAAMALISQP